MLAILFASGLSEQNEEDDGMERRFVCTQTDFTSFCHYKEVGTLVWVCVKSVHVEQDAILFGKRSVGLQQRIRK